MALAPRPHRSGRAAWLTCAISRRGCAQLVESALASPPPHAANAFEEAAAAAAAASMADASYASPTVAELLRACCECSLPPAINRGMARAVHEAALRPCALRPTIYHDKKQGSR
jgi:hypothetical protein